MIILPERLKKKLEQDQLLFGEVNASIAKFTPWFSDNKMVFFPEYTDHGTNHLQEVLNTASSIISDESWSLISTQDAAAIILATLLHDCAMHLSEDGFYALISDDYPMLESRYDSQTIAWKERWLSFFAEAKRWDGKKLKLLFGEIVPIRKIPSNKNDLNRRDCLLIGEFLRREHANLAHSIALLGVPPFSQSSLKLSLSDNNLCDLIGFIAKSHNMSLRAATDKLGTSQKRSAFNVHAPYIMGVLRISDYIQVHSSRADKQLLSVKSLTSPISKGEWDKHGSILDINQVHDDPEALYIDAEPQSATIFKGLKSLFSDIQKELDSTWSVIGEVYGRFHPFEKLGINIRRIRTSIDDENKYVLEKKPNFVPLPLKFKTSDAEMLSLLVSPLYGNSPAVGIRELIQNSVDACNELFDYYEKTGNLNYSKDDINVVVKIEKEKGEKASICITDTGIGMSLATIENYFLNIGASFRNSDKWKELHETDGKSNVHRTGRFGVGLLAAFLLGNEIIVETKHASEAKGFKFTCTKDSEDICVIPIECDIGTKIKIELSDDVFTTLVYREQDWDWYCLSTPKLTRIIKTSEKEKILDQKTHVPISGAELTDTKWFRIEHDDFDDILWSSENKDDNYYSLATITCNGIRLSQRGIHYRANLGSSPIDIESITPSLVIYDQDGKMPINLTRDGLTSTQLPFNNELIRDLSSKLANEIYREFYIKDSVLNDDLVMRMLNHNLKYCSTDGSYITGLLSDLFYYKNKTYPSNVCIIHSLKPSIIFVDAVSDQDNINSISCAEFFGADVLYAPFNISRRSRSAKVQYLRAILDKNIYQANIPCTGKRLFIRRDDISDVLKPSNFPKSAWAKLALEWSDDEWAVMKYGSVPDLVVEPHDILDKLEAGQQSLFICIYVDWDSDYNPPEASVFSDVWHELIS